MYYCPRFVLVSNSAGMAQVSFSGAQTLIIHALVSTLFLSFPSRPGSDSMFNLSRITHAPPLVAWPIRLRLAADQSLVAFRVPTISLQPTAAKKKRGSPLLPLLATATLSALVPHNTISRSFPPSFPSPSSSHL